MLPETCQTSTENRRINETTAPQMENEPLSQNHRCSTHPINHFCFPPEGSPDNFMLYREPQSRSAQNPKNVPRVKPITDRDIKLFRRTHQGRQTIQAKRTVPPPRKKQNFSNQIMTTQHIQPIAPLSTRKILIEKTLRASIDLPADDYLMVPLLIKSSNRSTHAPVTITHANQKDRMRGITKTAARRSQQL